MMRTILLFTMCLFAPWVCANDAAAEPEKIYWIDTRTEAEFAQGHVDGALLIPFDVIAEGIDQVTVDKNADIRVYCRSGRRSGIAKETLNGMGYTNVVNEGGYEDIITR